MSLSGLKPLSLSAGFISVACLISACATTSVQPPAPISTGGPRPDPRPVETPVDPLPTPVTDTADEIDPTYRPTGRFVTPSHMAGRDIKRVAVLLPFTHSSSGVRNQASSLLASIEMAMFDMGDESVLLLPKDTAGDVQKTSAVAEEAIEEGADVIIGPLFADNVRAATGIARQADIPVIAFSNDRSAAGGGAYLMSFPPEEEVSRVVDWAVLNGISRFAFLGPRTSYSQRVETSLRFEAARRRGIVIASEFYDSHNDAPVDEANRLASRIQQSLELNDGKVALMIPDNGVRLLGVAPLIPYYGVNLRRVQYIGTSLWDDPSIWREPVLENAAFASAPPRDIAAFERDYERNYSREPSSLGSLGYDSAALAISFLQDGVVEAAELEHFDGFRGVNGLFRFRGDGTIERGLSVLAIQPRGTEEIDGAPDSFNPGVN